MKKIAISLFTCALVFPLASQGIMNNGAYIVMSGNAQIYIDGGTNGDYTSQANGRITPSAAGIITLEGDWNNNAGNTGFTADAGTVVLNDAAQAINGTASTTFYNLTLLGTGTKTLNVNTSVGGVATTTGILSIGTRPLNLNSRMLTITNPALTAVTYTTGYVISETNVAANASIMRWNAGTTTGLYTFPFGTIGGVQIPLGFNKTSATSSSISIATRPTAASDNLPWTTGVTHMFDPTLAQDGADEAVVDRWWDFTTSATITADVTFRYRGFENTMIVPYNTGNIGAQYWAAGWLPDNANIGSAPAVVVGVGAVTATALSFTAASLTPMVLSSLAAPLPVELTSFTSMCQGNSILVEWTTASEMNNSFFTVQRSDDGHNFRDVGTVAGSGTTSQMHSYSIVDNEPTSGSTYYRLKQTDYNGQSVTTAPIFQDQCGNGGEVVSSYGNGSDVIVDIYSPNGSDYTIQLFDAQGKLVADRIVTAVEGANHFELDGVIPSVGIYMISVNGASGIQYSNKLYLQN